MTVYRPGDRVLCISDIDGIYHTEGLFGIVLNHVDGDEHIGVQFDVRVAGHSCDGLGTVGYCLWCSGYELELVENLKPKKSGITSFLEKHS